MSEKRDRQNDSAGNHRPPRTRRVKLLTWRRFLAACVLVPVAVVVALALIPTTRWVYATGYVMTDQEAEIRPSVQGAVAAKLVGSGDIVEKDQPIISLNDQVEAAAWQQADADLQAKQAQLKQLRSAQSLEKAQRKEQAYQAKQSLALAEGNMERITQANKSGGVFSHREIEDAQLKVELARSRLRELELTRDPVMVNQIEVLTEQIGSARKNVVLRKAELDMRQIKSPMRGTIQLNRIEPGEVVSPEDVLGQVFNRDRWIIKLKISERWISYVEADQDVQVSLAAFPSFRFGYLPARVARVQRVVTPQRTGDGIFYVEAAVEDADLFDLQPGMIATADINAGTTNWLYRLIGW